MGKAVHNIVPPQIGTQLRAAVYVVCDAINYGVYRVMQFFALIRHSAQFCPRSANSGT
jgi:hypothetical protein